MRKCPDCNVTLADDEGQYCEDCICEFCRLPFSKVGFYFDGMCKKCHDDATEIYSREQKFQHENA